MNRQVNLTKRVKTESGLRYCPVVLEPMVGSGQITSSSMENRKRTPRAYYLEWRNGARRVRVSVGKDVGEAASKRHRKEAELNAVNSGVTVVSPGAQDGRRSLPTTIADYLAEIKLTKKPKTHSAYSTALEYFQDSARSSAWRISIEKIC